MNKNRIINFLLTLVVIACFTGAGLLGWQVYKDLHTIAESTEDAKELQSVALQTPAPTDTPRPTAAPTLSAAAPAGDLSTDAAPEALHTPLPTSDILEPDSEGETDDTQLLVIMANWQGGFDVLATPPPSQEPVPATDAPSAAPAKTEAPLPAVPATDTPGPSAAPTVTSAVQVSAAPADAVTNAPAMDTPDASYVPTVTAAAQVSAAAPSVTPQPTAPVTDTPAPTVTPTPAPTDSPTPTPQPTATPYVPLVGHSIEGQLRFTVDFPLLTQINKDTRGWLYQEGTVINYPVVQGKNNDVYLTRLFSGSTNGAGSIFMDCGNSAYFTDMLTFIYGHNRKDGNMFGTIPLYKEQAYYEAHPTFDLVTPYENYLLEIFSMMEISTEDTSYWHVKSFSGREDFEAYVARLLEESYIKTNVQPEWGDQLVALTTCTNQIHEHRYVLYARMRPVVYATDADSLSLTKKQFDAMEGTSRIIDVPGRGPMQYYAQNDPIWSNMFYEVKGRTDRGRLGGAGCAPTSMAIVLANLIDEKYYWYLSYYSGLENGLTFCQDSVNQYYCTHMHAQYRLEKPEEYRRYLPVAIASFCTGNNSKKEEFRIPSGTGSGFFARIAQIYGMTLNTTHDRDTVVECLKRGGVAITNVGRGNPYTGGGHYMAVVAADDEYLYIMDPFLKEDYSRTDKRHIITVIEPGLIRLNLSDWHNLELAKFYLFEKLD